jgi:hypothetical protein
MREAGFETDYDRELGRRQATKRRIAGALVSFAVVLGVLGGLSGLLLDSGHLSRGAAIAVSTLVAVGAACGLVLVAFQLGGFVKSRLLLWLEGRR